MSLKNDIKQCKTKLMEKLDILDCFAEDRLFFIEHSKGKVLVGVEQFDYSNQDKYFFLYDGADILNSEDDFYGPVAMIKFMPNQNNNNEMFIRRLEFINDNCRGKGYASCLIKLFEAYCHKNGYKNMGGEMIPLHDVPEQVVENYYKKNGFTITAPQGQKLIDKKIEKPLQMLVDGVTLIDNPYNKTLKDEMMM